MGAGMGRAREGGIVLWVRETRRWEIEIATDRLIENFAWRRLVPHRADENEPVELARRHGSHLGSDPTAKTEADQRCPIDVESGKQRLINDRQIAPAAQPLRSFGPTVARMVGNDHVQAAC